MLGNQNNQNQYIASEGELSPTNPNPYNLPHVLSDLKLNPYQLPPGVRDKKSQNGILKSSGSVVMT